MWVRNIHSGGYDNEIIITGQSKSTRNIIFYSLSKIANKFNSNCILWKKWRYEISCSSSNKCHYETSIIDYNTKILYILYKIGGGGINSFLISKIDITNEHV